VNGSPGTALDQVPKVNTPTHVENTAGTWHIKPIHIQRMRLPWSSFMWPIYSTNLACLQ